MAIESETSYFRICDRCGKRSNVESEYVLPASWRYVYPPLEHTIEGERDTWKLPRPEDVCGWCAEKISEAGKGEP